MLKVTNLPVPTTDSDLYELFSGYEKIEIDPPIEIKNGNSIAYVKLGNDEDEKDAIKKLNRTKWRDEYYIRVDTFRGKRSIGDPGGGGDKNSKP
jgi:RNA recognition motif-containing protein